MAKKWFKIRSKFLDLYASIYGTLGQMSISFIDQIILPKFSINGMNAMDKTDRLGYCRIP